jgi:hypothetical protein
MTVMRLREDALTWREIDGEIVAVDVERSTYLAANPAGTLLWQRLARGATREELAGALVEWFDIELERAQSDADAFVAAVAERGLLAR